MLQEVRFETIDDLIKYSEKYPNSNNRYHLNYYKSAINNKVDWTLSYNNGHWNRTEIYLSEELGESIGKIWTKKDRYGVTQNYGTLTLAGILKRLGRTDVVKNINKLKNEKEELSKKMHHVNCRAHAISQIKELIEYMIRNEMNDTVENITIKQLTDLKSKLEE